MNKDYKFLRIREHAELAGAAARWFHEKWGIPQEAYEESIHECLNGQAPVPQWYVVLDGETIIAGLGVIENDFHKRRDLTPNVCAVYVETEYRNQGIAGEMLRSVCDEFSRMGVCTLYLLTDHVGFYERYGWQFLCMVQEEDSEQVARMYRHPVNSEATLVPVEHPSQK